MCWSMLGLFSIYLDANDRTKIQGCIVHGPQPNLLRRLAGTKAAPVRYLSWNSGLDIPIYGGKDRPGKSCTNTKCKKLLE